MPSLTAPISAGYFTALFQPSKMLKMIADLGAVVALVGERHGIGLAISARSVAVRRRANSCPLPQIPSSKQLSWKNPPAWRFANSATCALVSDLKRVMGASFARDPGKARKVARRKGLKGLID